MFKFSPTKVAQGPPMEDQNTLVTALKEISDKYWAENNAPLLLSALPRMIEGKVPNYRSVLGSRTLKVFINETAEVGGYKLLEHPTQRVRVGVAPAAAQYEFPQEAPRPPRTIAVKSNQEATLAFFRALATLPDADLDKVVIPGSVLVKLLK